MGNIETILAKYPDVPRSVLLKYELNRRGLNMTDAANKACQNVDAVFKGDYMFSYDAGKRKTLKEKVPFTFRFRRDNTYLFNRTRESSRYAMDYIDGKFCITEDGNIIEEIYFPPSPHYYRLKTEDGVLRSALAQSHGDLLVVMPRRYCDFWKDNTQCRFCDIVPVTKEQSKTKELGAVHRDHEQIGETVEMAFKEGMTSYRHVIVTGGSILGTYHGLDEIGYYSQTLEAIFKRLPAARYPSSVQLLPPKNKDEWKRLKATGVTSVQPNMEVWDRQRFQKICPGKEKYIGYDEYVRRIIEGAEVFGAGLINPNFVIGVEMSKPDGFTSVDEAVESTLAGFEFLMQNGVFPRTSIWTVEKKSALGNQEPAPLEYYVKLGRGYKELRHRYGFGDNLPCFCRNCNPQDTLHDWDWADRLEKEKKKKTAAH